MRGVSLNKFTEILRKNGYYTIGLTTGGWLSKYFGFDKGFIKFYDGSSRKQAKSPRFKLKEFIKNSEILGEPVRYIYTFTKNITGIEEDIVMNLTPELWNG